IVLGDEGRLDLGGDRRVERAVGGAVGRRPGLVAHRRALRVAAGRRRRRRARNRAGALARRRIGRATRLAGSHAAAVLAGRLRGRLPRRGRLVAATVAGCEHYGGRYGRGDHSMLLQTFDLHTSLLLVGFGCPAGIGGGLLGGWLALGSVWLAGGSGVRFLRPFDDFAGTAPQVRVLAACRQVFIGPPAAFAVGAGLHRTAGLVPLVRALEAT